jgi:hypothetical protein
VPRGGDTVQGWDWGGRMVDIRVRRRGETRVGGGWGEQGGYERRPRLMG